MKRYSMVAGVRGMDLWQELEECDDGEFVAHADHLTALAAVTEQRDVLVEAVLKMDQCDTPVQVAMAEQDAIDLAASIKGE